MEEKVKEVILLSNPDTDNNILKRYDSMIDYEQNVNNDEKTNENDNYNELDEFKTIFWIYNNI